MAGPQIGSLTLGVEADVDPNKFKRQLDGQLSDPVKAVGRDLTGVFASAFALDKIKDFGAAAISAASDLQESANVTGLVFKDARAEIDEFVESAATGLGQSETAAREATAQFGGLLNNLGFAADETVEWSKTLTSLSSDLASAFNTEPEEAVVALGAAMRGESEPARRFNIMLDDASVRAKAVELGLAATAAEVDNNGKAQARLALIMEQTTDVQGDFANTADGAANAQRILSAQWEEAQAQIGSALLPVFERFVGAMSGLLEGFESLPEPVQDLVTNFVAWGGVVGGSVFAVGKLTGSMTNLYAQFKGINPEAESFQATARNLRGSLSALAIGVGAVAAAWQTYVAAQKEGQSQADEVADWSTEMALASVEGENAFGRIGELLGNVSEQQRIAQEDVKRLGDSWGWVGYLVGPVADKMGEIENAEAIAAQERWNALLEEFGSDLSKIQAQAQVLSYVYGITADEAAEWLAQQALVGTVFDDGQGAVDSFRGEMDRLNGATAEQVANYEELKTAFEEYQTALKAAFDPIFAYQDALNSWEDATADAKQAQIELTDAQNAYNFALATGDQEAVRQAFLGLAAAQEEAQRTTEGVAQSNFDLTVRQNELALAVQTGDVTAEKANRTWQAWSDQGLFSSKEQAFQVWLQLQNAIQKAGEFDQVDVTADATLRINYVDAAGKIGEDAANSAREILNQQDLNNNGIIGLATGGPIPGSPGQPFPFIGHGGEYVLSAEVVEAIKRGATNSHLGSTVTGGGMSGSVLYADTRFVNALEDLRMEVERWNESLRDVSKVRNSSIFDAELNPDDSFWHNVFWDWVRGNSVPGLDEIPAGAMNIGLPPDLHAAMSERFRSNTGRTTTSAASPYSMTQATWGTAGPAPDGYVYQTRPDGVHLVPLQQALAYKNQPGIREAGFGGHITDPSGYGNWVDSNTPIVGVMNVYGGGDAQTTANATVNTMRDMRHKLGR